MVSRSNATTCRWKWWHSRPGRPQLEYRLGCPTSAVAACGSSGITGFDTRRVQNGRPHAFSSVNGTSTGTGTGIQSVQRTSCNDIASASASRVHWVEVHTLSGHSHLQLLLGALSLSFLRTTAVDCSNDEREECRGVHNRECQSDEYFDAACVEVWGLCLERERAGGGGRGCGALPNGRGKKIQ